MKFEGGCYCKAVRYQAEGEPMFKGQCHCRECQYLTGGHPNVIMAMPEIGLQIHEGRAEIVQAQGLPNAVTREFCAECGTHLTTRTPNLPGAALIKVGTFDDPSLFGMPQMAIFTIDKQVFHHVPTGIPSFERVPG